MPDAKLALVAISEAGMWVDPDKDPRVTNMDAEDLVTVFSTTVWVLRQYELSLRWATPQDKRRMIFEHALFHGLVWIVNQVEGKLDLQTTLEGMQTTSFEFFGRVIFSPLYVWWVEELLVSDDNTALVPR